MPRTFEEAKASYATIRDNYKNEQERLDIIISQKPNLSELEEVKERKAELLEWHNKIEQTDKLCTEYRLLCAVMKHNVYVAFWNEYFPRIKAVWDKYAGKKHGEKTSEKIRNEIKQATGVHFYEYSHYGYPTINIDFGELLGEWYNNFKLELTQWNNSVGARFITEDNTIIEMDITPPHKCVDFVEEPLTYIRDMKSKYKAIEEKAEELMELVEDFNANTIHGFKAITYSKTFLRGIETEND